MTSLALTRYRAEQRADAAYARAQMRREVARNRAEEDEHERILSEGSPRLGGAACVAVLEPGRIEEDALALAREREWDRTLECGD